MDKKNAYLLVGGDPNKLTALITEVYQFIEKDGAKKDICKMCDFDGSSLCEFAPCISYERKDCKNGYYKKINN